MIDCYLVQYVIYKLAVDGGLEKVLWSRDPTILNAVSFTIISSEMCTCSATGDPHYRTYDGQMIHFMGVCKYLMTKSLTKNDPCAFSVEVKNEHRGRNRRVAYTRSVDVKIYGKVVRLAPGHKVFVRHSTFF